MTAPAGQKAKMLAGELYLASDPELIAEDLRAQDLLFRFNADFVPMPRRSGAHCWLSSSIPLQLARCSSHRSAATTGAISRSVQTRLSTTTVSFWIAIGSPSGARCRSPESPDLYGHPSTGSRGAALGARVRASGSDRGWSLAWWWRNHLPRRNHWGKYRRWRGQRGHERPPRRRAGSWQPMPRSKDSVITRVSAFSVSRGECLRLDIQLLIGCVYPSVADLTSWF